MSAVKVGGTVVDAEERVPSAKSAVLRSTNPRSMAQRNAASRSATPRNVATRSVKNRSDSALRVLRKKELHVGTEYMYMYMYMYMYEAMHSVSSKQAKGEGCERTADSGMAAYAYVCLRG